MSVFGSGEVARPGSAPTCTPRRSRTQAGTGWLPAETTALVAFLETLHPRGQAPARDASQAGRRRVAVGRQMHGDLHQAASASWSTSICLATLFPRFSPSAAAWSTRRIDSCTLTFGLTALQDQELAGSLMWFWVTIVYLLPATVVTLRMLSPGAGRAAGKGLARPLKIGPGLTARL